MFICQGSLHHQCIWKANTLTAALLAHICLSVEVDHCIGLHFMCCVVHSFIQYLEECHACSYVMHAVTACMPLRHACRPSDFLRSRNCRLETESMKFQFFFFNVSHTWLLALFCPFRCLHTALIVLCLFYCPFTC